MGVEEGVARSLFIPCSLRELITELLDGWVGRDLGWISPLSLFFWGNH